MFHLSHHTDLVVTSTGDTDHKLKNCLADREPMVAPILEGRLGLYSSLLILQKNESDHCFAHQDEK